MPRITYIDTNEIEQTVIVEDGQSVMQGAIVNGIAGIDAICGGSCACATCHCYVSPEWYERLPSVEELEDEMLDDTAAERREHSRLSCQLTVTEEMDGLVVTIPECQ